jgi:hypothetical protein
VLMEAGIFIAVIAAVAVAAVIWKAVRNTVLAVCIVVAVGFFAWLFLGGRGLAAYVILSVIALAIWVYRFASQKREDAEPRE